MAEARPEEATEVSRRRAEGRFRPLARVREEWATALPWVVFLVAFAAYPWLFQSAFLHNLGILVALTALMATGWNILGGVTGQISFGHALFFGIGAYATALANTKFGLNPWLGILLGMVVSAVVALLVGLPVLRLRGHYFAIAMIAVGQIGFLVFLNTAWVGGARGIDVPIEPDSLLRLQFSGLLKFKYYYVAFAFLVVALVLTALLLRSRTGYYLVSIREDQDAAAAAGVPLAFYKEIAFAISAVFVAAAGGFFTQYVLFIDPFSTLTLALSVQIAIAAILGGTRSMWGPVLGAVVIVVVTEMSRRYFGAGGDALNLVLYGFLVMAIAAFEPNGMIGIGRRVAGAIDRASPGLRRAVKAS